MVNFQGARLSTGAALAFMKLAALLDDTNGDPVLRESECKEQPARARAGLKKTPR